MTYEDVLSAFGAEKSEITEFPLLLEFVHCAGFGLVGLHNSFDESLLRGALVAIPAADYKVWIDIGIALRNAAEAGEMKEEDAYEMWRAWSETDASYDEGMCERKWQGITPAGLMGLGSVFFLAKEYGWKGQRNGFWTQEERKMAAFGEAL